MESPSCIQDEPFPHPLEPEPSAPAQPGATKPGDKRFRLWYVGGSCLDRRTTLPMLPWLMAEIRRRSQKPEAGGCGAPAAREVLLVLSAPFLRCVPAPGAGVGGGASSGAVQPNTGVFIFEHKAQHISRFIHNSHDLTYFAYLIKAQPDDPESQMACHVFRATDPNQVSSGCQGRDWGRGDWQGWGFSCKNSLGSGCWFALHVARSGAPFVPFWDVGVGEKAIPGWVGLGTSWLP